MTRSSSCPMTTRQIIDEYFIENRTRVLDLAAYLDRLDRSADGESSDADFRMQALERALRVLISNDPEKIHQIQMIFSDPSTEPKPKLEGKSASGAWNPLSEVR
jgi:hypothetical protein